jgi:hypothetical protein
MTVKPVFVWELQRMECLAMEYVELFYICQALTHSSLKATLSLRAMSNPSPLEPLLWHCEASSSSATVCMW